MSYTNNSNLKNHLERFRLNLFNMICDYVEQNGETKQSLISHYKLPSKVASDIINKQSSGFNTDNLLELLLITGVLSSIKLDDTESLKYKFLGEKIEFYRTYNKMSQAVLASKIGSNQPTISSWERGKTKPGANNIEKLCLVFGVVPADFKGLEPCDNVLVDNTIQLDASLTLSAFKSLYNERALALKVINDTQTEDKSINSLDFDLDNIASIIFKLGGKSIS